MSTPGTCCLRRFQKKSTYLTVGGCKKKPPGHAMRSRGGTAPGSRRTSLKKKRVRRVKGAETSASVLE